jgi:hypothetical protein
MDDTISLEQTLVNGSSGRLTADSNDQSNKPLVIRGVIKIDHANKCRTSKRDFWYIDTGYFGNFPSPGNPKGSKKWHRVVKNENQQVDIVDVPEDRWNNIVADDPRLEWKGWKNYDKKILLVMPNPKACLWYGVNYEQWVEKTKADIAKYSDLPVEVRIKGSRRERNKGYTIYDAFDSGVYATVAMNSMAALESVLYGIPAFVSVPCAASPLASMDLSQLGNPFKPHHKLIGRHAKNLAYTQFTTEEILNGTAYNLTEKYR